MDSNNDLKEVNTRIIANYKNERFLVSVDDLVQAGFCFQLFTTYSINRINVRKQNQTVRLMLLELVLTFSVIRVISIVLYC